MLFTKIVVQGDRKKIIVELSKLCVILFFRDMEVGSRQCKFNLIVIFIICYVKQTIFFFYFVPFWFNGKLIVDIRDQSFHIYIANIVIFILILIRSSFFFFFNLYVFKRQQKVCNHIMLCCCRRHCRPVHTMVSVR